MHYSIVDVVARLSLDRNSKYFFEKYIINGRPKDGGTTLIFRSCIFSACATSIINTSRCQRDPDLPVCWIISNQTDHQKHNDNQDPRDSDSSDGDSQDRGD